MKKVLEITKVVRGNKYLGTDKLGRVYPIDTTRSLRKGQSVLVINDIVEGIVQTTTPEVYNV